MIVSASYRTDIPAFYGPWFLNRLRAGFCRVVNPYHKKQVARLSLEPGDVEGFVFWTRNLGPFRKVLEEVRERGFPFLVSYTITGYPEVLEPGVVEDRKAVEHMRRLASEFGPRAGVWRYDTILFTSLTDGDFHLRNFERLARALSGSTDEVVVSFAQIYRKTRRNLDRAARDRGFTWEDPGGERKRALLRELSDMARAEGMELSVCAQPELCGQGIPEARCVDAERLSDLAGRPIPARDKPHRPECRCFESRDLGAYDSCPMGCLYCYAVQDRVLAARRFEEHDPEGEFLLPPA